VSEQYELRIPSTEDLNCDLANHYARLPLDGRTLATVAAIAIRRALHAERRIAEEMDHAMQASANLAQEELRADHALMRQKSMEAVVAAARRYFAWEETPLWDRRRELREALIALDAEEKP